MAEMREADFKKAIEQGALSGTYLLYGAEKYTMLQSVEKVVRKFMAAGFSDFNLQRFDGNDVDADAVEAALDALPFLAEQKCVTLSDLNADGLSANELEQYCNMIRNLPESSIFIIYLPVIELGKRLSAKWKQLFSIPGNHLTTVEYKRKSNADLEKYLIMFAEKRGCTLSRDLAKRILFLCGTDLQNLSHEIGKLCGYAKSGTITREQVDAVVTNNVEMQVFALSDAIIAGEYEKAYHIVDNLLGQNEEPVMIVAMLSSAYVNLYRVKCMLQSGKSVMDLTSAFEYKGKEFMLRHAEQDSSRFSLAVLRESLDLLLEADLALKGGAGSSRDEMKRVVLEELIAKLLLAAQEKDG